MSDSTKKAVEPLDDDEILAETRARMEEALEKRKQMKEENKEPIQSNPDDPDAPNIE